MGDLFYIGSLCIVILLMCMQLLNELRRKKQDTPSEPEKMDEFYSYRSICLQHAEQKHDEQVRKSEVKRHYANINACEDCVFQIQGVCADSRNKSNDERGKKLCFKRPAKNISNCKHYNKIDANEKAKRIFDKQYVCPDCGAFLNE